MPNQNHEIIKYDPNQDVAIKLDLTTNQIIFNPKVDTILQKSQDIVKTGNQLAKTDINQIDEDQMTALNKEIRPISKFQTESENMRKTIKKQLQARDDEILDAFDEKLKAHHFDEIQSVVKKLHVLQQDYKANRGNKRWDELHQYFNAQLPLYPELTQYAKNTLANFDFYRVNHPGLVSNARTKPITKKTIQELNDEIYNYHLDVQRMLKSTLNQRYYADLINEYASEPSTNQMLMLLDKFGSKQIVDDNEALHQSVIDLAKDKLQKLWLNNPIINQKFDQLNPNPKNFAPFQQYKQQLMQETNDHIVNGIDPMTYLQADRKILDEKLEIQLKMMIEANFKIIKEKLIAYTKDQPVAVEQSTPPATGQYQWLLDDFKTNHIDDVHDNDSVKARLLRDLYTNVTDTNSLWHAHIKSNHDLIGLTRFILDL